MLWKMSVKYLEYKGHGSEALLIGSSIDRIVRLKNANSRQVLLHEYTCTSLSDISQPTFGLQSTYVVLTIIISVSYMSICTLTTQNNQFSVILVGFKWQKSTTSKKRTTSQERTKAAVPKCPFFRGSTV